MNVITKPLISIVIPCYNAEQHMDAAIGSIARQTYENLEIILINDGSIDTTAEIAHKWEQQDSRVKVIRNEQNLKLIKTLNRGISVASGDFIARMDSDDIARADRLEKQLAYMLQHPETDVTSCYCRYINNNGSVHSRNTHFSCRGYWALRFMCMFESPLLHPGILAKREVLQGNLYADSPETAHIEDYELWCRLLNQGYKFEVIPEFLMDYRRNPVSVSFKHRALQNANQIKCANQQLIRELPGLQAPLNAVEAITTKGKEFPPSDIPAVLKMLDTIRDKFLAQNNISRENASELISWVQQRKLRILAVYFLQGRGRIRWKVLVYTISHLQLFLSLRTWTNIANKGKGMASSFLARFK